jgi:hypothetical protein
MAGYTKADYDNLYRIRVERLLPPAPLFAGTREEVRLHYHKFVMRDTLINRWSRLQSTLQIANTELLLIVGAGFGWGVEGAIAATGCTTVGIDISDYIVAEQGNTEEAEIREAITAVGLDPDTGRGAEILAAVYDGQPRTNVIVLQEDMQTNQSRNAIRSTLGGWPTVVVFEDIVDANTTDQEITQAQNAATLFAGDQRVIWTFDGLPNRSMQDLQTLTGAEVISNEGQTHLVP